MKIHHIKLLLYCCYFLSMLFLIQSCGGDSGSDVSVSSRVDSQITPSKTGIEIVSIKNNAPLHEQTDVLLSTNILNNNNATITYQWHQVSGIAITLTNQNQPTAKLTIPNIVNNEVITIALTINDNNGNIDTKSIDLTLQYVNTPPVVTVNKELSVTAFSEVTLESDVTDQEGGVTSQWQQKSGIPVEVTPLQHTAIFFKAPSVTTDTTLTFELTAIDNDGASTTEVVTVNVLPAIVDIPPHVLLLTKERIAQVKNNIAQDDTAYNLLLSKITNYFTVVPYNAGEYAGSFALAFYLTGDNKYIQRAIELLEHAYFSEPNIGWQYYNNRNLFRVNARWAIMGYTWIKSYITEDQRIKIENILALWSDYWLEHVDFQNDFASFRVEDTDNLTSLAENITLLGYALKDSSKHANLSSQLLIAGDTLLNRFVVNYYMNDIMAGGAWAEGSDYSPNTQRHWIRIFLINKDQRNIPYPTNYAHDAMLGLLHQTLGNYSGMYKYGSEEAATDYEPLSEDYRYEFALELMGILEDEKDLTQLYQWFNALLSSEGYRQGSMITHFQRLLFHDPLFTSELSPYPESTINIASGVGLVSSRSNWGDNSTNLYFINRKIRVDHEHKDALSFDLAYQGKWLSKESTGYSGPATSSRAHNTILIENASADGSSSPTYRPAGDPSFYEIYNDDDITLISADATKTYNMIGYFATNYAKQVNRQIAFIKPSTVVVYDHIVTDKSATKDLVQYSPLGISPEIEHTRWVKVIQHVQAQPAPLIDYFNSYQVISEGNKLVYQVHWPVGAKINIIDEAPLWQDTLEYEMPENQKKWHFEVTNNNLTENNEFITTLNFGKNIEGVNYAVAPIVMTKENGLILQGNIKGVALYINNKTYIILFNQTPHLPITAVDYIKPQGFETAKIYGVGFELNN